MPRLPNANNNSLGAHQARLSCWGAAAASAARGSAARQETPACSSHGKACSSGHLHSMCMHQKVCVFIAACSIRVVLAPGAALATAAQPVIQENYIHTAFSHLSAQHAPQAVHVLAKLQQLRCIGVTCRCCSCKLQQQPSPDNYFHKHKMLIQKYLLKYHA
jgi:hypothetical protein